MTTQETAADSEKTKKEKKSSNSSLLNRQARNHVTAQNNAPHYTAINPILVLNLGVNSNIK